MTHPTLLGAAAPPTTYQITNSLRANGTSAYLGRTPSAAGNQTTWTFSCWLKRGALDGANNQCLFGLRVSSNNTMQVGTWGSNSDQLWFDAQWLNTYTIRLVTTQVFRDPSAWYHVVAVFDANNAVQADRARLYVNGSRITSFAVNSNNWPQGQAGYVNSINAVGIGAQANSVSASYFSGYLADCHLIDGQALPPSGFGRYDANGVWVPIKYAGAYGTNGCKLEFKASGALGADTSGRGNDWGVSGFAAADQMVDTPTNNFCTFSPLDRSGSGIPSEGNTLVSGTATVAAGTIAVSAGQYVAEFEVAALGSTNASAGFGFYRSDYPLSVQNINAPQAFYMINGSSVLWVNWSGGQDTFGYTLTVGDVYRFECDFTALTFSLYRNGSLLATHPIPAGYSWKPFAYTEIPAHAIRARFGANGFLGTPSAGYKTLCTANLPTVAIPQPRKHFDVNLRIGTGAVTNVTGMRFAPGFVWVKPRVDPYSGRLFDSVRGPLKEIYTDSNSAEVTLAGSLTAFNSDGYSIGTAPNVNTSGFPLVDWCWKAGDAVVSNNAGSTTSQVSADTAAGFSVVTYTGTGANASIGHGLGAAPKFVIVKSRSTNGLNWPAYHASLGAAKCIYLDSTNAAVTLDCWNNTAPTATVFSVGGTGALANVNGNGTAYVAYCFTDIAGYSKFGTFISNASSDNAFVHCGFLPRWLMYKRSNASGDSWTIYDSARDVFNVCGTEVYTNTPQTESSGNARFDFTANGFKCRSAGLGNSGDTYIFAAFADHPFGGSNVAPTPAR